MKMKILKNPFTLCLLLSASQVSTPLSLNAEEQPSTPETTTASREKIRTEMRQVYASAEKLYSYVWAPQRFVDPAEKQTIIALLDSLSGEFHRIDEDAEPGFSAALATQQRMLKDISRRFAEGNTDYASWRLRAVLGNCTACHSRLATPYNFVGEGPSQAGESFEEKKALAEFYSASRQFDKALSEFYSLAAAQARDSHSTREAVELLMQWLLIQVRVKSQPAIAATELEKLIAEGSFNEEQRELLFSWASDLKALKVSQDKASVDDQLAEVKALLAPVVAGESVQDQERHIVTTLRAGGILHSLLGEKLNPDQGKAALYLLGLTYARTPLTSLEPFALLHLENCIRQFPGSNEAKQSFTLYKDILEFSSSGSGGMHLEDEDKKLLAELQKLAEKS